MSSLPDVSLDTTSGSGEVAAAEVPGVHVSDDAPTIKVTTKPAPKSPAGDPAQGDLAVKGDLPDGDLDGDRMSTAERGLVVVRHWVTQASDGAHQVTSTPGGVLAARPPSFTEYRAYVRSRAWVPEGYERGWLIWVPVAYYNTVGNAGVLTGLSIQWLTGRMLHFHIAIGVTVLAAVLWLIFS